MGYKDVTLVCLIFVGIYRTEAFSLVRKNEHQDTVSVDLGKSFTMTCTADNDYEFCVFEHSGNKVCLILSISIPYFK